jgi:hypothetical protein
VLTKWRGFDEAEDTEEPIYDKWIDVPRMLRDHLQLLGDNGDELAIQGLGKVKEWEANRTTISRALLATPTPIAMTMVRHASSLSNYFIFELVFCYGAQLCVTHTRVPYIASTTLVHRYIVNSNATPFIPSHLSQNTAIKLALQLDPVSSRQHKPTGGKTTPCPKNMYHEIRLRRPHTCCWQNLLGDQFDYCKGRLLLTLFKP